MTAIDRAAEVLAAQDRRFALDPDLGEPPTPMQMAQALDDADLLVTDEIQAVLDATTHAWLMGGMDGRSRLGRAVAAYLATRSAP